MWPLRSSNPVVSPSEEGNEKTVEHYLSLSSASRDKNTFTSSDDCEIAFDDIHNVIGLELVNFEIPHTRYAIDSDNNSLYISEQVGDQLYHFYGLRLGTGGYTISNLCTSLELSQQAAMPYNGDTTGLMNSYSIMASQSVGKVAIVSSGTVPYNIHVCTETLTVTHFDKQGDSSALVSFLAPYEYILAPGAMLMLKLHTHLDREVQVIATEGARTVELFGDFTDLTTETLDGTDSSTMVPYSSFQNVSDTLGLGDTDLVSDVDTAFEVLGVQSPIATSNPRILVDFPIFVSPGDSVSISDSSSMLDLGGPYTVSSTYDDTHFDIYVDANTLLDVDEDTDLQITSDKSTFSSVSDISITGIDNNTVTVLIQTFEVTDYGVGETVYLTGLSSPEMTDRELNLTSVNSASLQLTATFTYPVSAINKDTMSISPCNAATGHPTTYVSPHRFDLSKGRRMMLCRASIDGRDLGTTHIQDSRTVFFGRIQLLSGADMVNFLSAHQAMGRHRFTSLVKKLHRLRFRFYNENGTEYNFEGVDYTVLLKITTLYSNTGV
ncbi:FirrV-1-A30 [Feldmannia irregularis virus a]|uniref:FirrV-1-A30 n=1 Tax=Feldmannia irregularis virus a TaxID=231992 RepID=Q6XM57_9PHYC|nr:FirrV-1-A30 [Feldmannia irregularis virus a]AAR26854.1 FirrV-1-A30 [Feldmannia irregularis virus a]